MSSSVPVTDPPPVPRTAAIVVAAGRGERLGVPAKVLVPLAGRPLLDYVLATLSAVPGLSELIIVAGPHTLTPILALVRARAWPMPVQVVRGGETRHASVRAGLQALTTDATHVAIHDGARPFATAALFTATIRAAHATGAAIAALPVTDTLKHVEADIITGSIDRTALWGAQTPQVFARDRLLAALTRASDPTITDEARLFETLSWPVAVVPGSATNVKVTHPADVTLAEGIVAMMERQPVIRTGIGYDAHVFAPGRRLVLGGVAIPHPVGLLGHSDADVLLHALADALLGAAALGDIGQHFPPTDAAFKDADSRRLLRETVRLLAVAGYAPAAVDATVIAEAPKINPHVPAMRAAIAADLGLSIAEVSIKATTNEGMGAIGRGEGIAALATATIHRVPAGRHTPS